MDACRARNEEVCRGRLSRRLPLSRHPSKLRPQGRCAPCVASPNAMRVQRFGISRRCFPAHRLQPIGAPRDHEGAITIAFRQHITGLCCQCKRIVHRFVAGDRGRSGAHTAFVFAYLPCPPIGFQRRDQLATKGFRAAKRSPPCDNKRRPQDGCRSPARQSPTRTSAPARSGKPREMVPRRFHRARPLSPETSAPVPAWRHHVRSHPPQFRHIGIDIRRQDGPGGWVAVAPHGRDGAPPRPVDPSPRASGRPDWRR